MELKYLPIRLFEKLRGPFELRMRARRMKAFADLMGLKRSARILDLGGLPWIWDTVETVHEITFLNLPGSRRFMESTHHDARFVEGDACHVDQFADDHFEIVFSNSVIEHVGPELQMQEFAREVQRLAKSYWVQTPAKVFPIEAHSGMPFWWFYPQWLRDYFIDRFARRLPGWTKMVAGTRILTRRQLSDLFPEAEIYTERLLGIPKSHSAYKVLKD